MLVLSTPDKQNMNKCKYLNFKFLLDSASFQKSFMIEIPLDSDSSLSIGGKFRREVLRTIPKMSVNFDHDYSNSNLSPST